MEILLTVIGTIIALCILGFLVVRLYIIFQGDAEMRFLVSERTPAAKVEEKEGRLDFNVEVPFDNIGKQEGTILDTYVRIYLPLEQYDDVLLRAKVNLEGVLRDDDYFEALLVPAGTKKRLIVRFEAYAKNGRTIKEALGGAPDVDVALFADCRARRELFTKKEIFTLTSEELAALVK